MTKMWLMLAALITLAGTIATIRMGPRLPQGAAMRLQRVPFALIRLAVARLPRDLREGQAAEWQAELSFILSRTEELPLTRLMRGLCYSLSLVWRAPAIGDSLKGVSRRAVRGLCIVAAAGSAAVAGYQFAATYAELQPATVLVHGPGGWLGIASGPTPEQTTLTAISYAVAGFGILLCSASLAIGTWRLIDFAIVVLATSQFLLYAGGGPVSSLAVGCGCLGVEAATVLVRLRRRLQRQRHRAIATPRP